MDAEILTNFLSNRQLGAWKDVKIVSNQSEWEEVYAGIQNSWGQLPYVIGLDCEWVSGRSLHVINKQEASQELEENGDDLSRKVALLQIATVTGFVALIRLCLIENMPKTLIDLLENEQIIKVGLEISEDSRRLKRDWGIILTNTLDIRFLYQEAKFGGKISSLSGPLSLKNLAENLLELKNAKNPKLALSNWAAQQLSQAQVAYAAADAQLSLDCFLKLIFQLLAGDQIIHENILALCQPYLNRRFKKGDASTKSQHKTSRKNGAKVYNCALLNGPLYHNCQLQAPDGQPLACIDRRKVDWYLKMDLAELILDNSGLIEDNLQDESGHAGISYPETKILKTIRLKNEPKNRPIGTELYYTNPKENQCVVCGSRQLLLRKCIVPKQYRKYFPETMKSHRSHDVVLLCLVCHEKASFHELALSQKLEIDCKAPRRSDWLVAEKEIRKIHKLAKALANKDHQLPKAREILIKSEICKFLGEETWNQDFIEQILQLKPVENMDFEAHGERVVKMMGEKVGGLPTFEKMWREHFLQKMDPKFLPQMWAVDHNKEKYEQLGL